MPTSSRCSGASSCASASACSVSAVCTRRATAPVSAPVARRALSASRSSADAEIPITSVPGPCSAWASRSSATGSRSAGGATTATRSLGPAKPSIPTWPNTCRLASCTYRFPGPTMTSTGLIESRSIGERGDRLGSAHPVHLARSGHPRGREDDWIDLAGRAGRRAHGHRGHPGHDRRHDSHHDRARIRRAATGHVHAGAVHRGLAQSDLVPVEGDHVGLWIHAGWATRRTFSIARSRPRPTAGSRPPSASSSSASLTVSGRGSAPLVSNRRVYSSTAASPRSRTSAMISATGSLTEAPAPGQARAARPPALHVGVAVPGRSAHTAPSRSSSASIAEAFSLWATGLAIRRAVQ